MTLRNVIEFVHDTRFEDLSPQVVAMAERCCLDTLGVAVAGRTTQLARIITAHVEQFYPAASPEALVADIPFTGKTANVIGAALAGGMTIDAFDAHDGHRLTKGHAGAAVVPALFAVCSGLTRAGTVISGPEFLTALVVGYEVSLRAGIALHGTVADYHTSGAWNALGVAALAARLMGLDGEATRHALGIAEYHGPRSQMMRCIDHPTMLKDGSGWGAMTGVSSSLLAQAGFTGAPSITVEAEEAQSYWRSLGTDWEFLRQYFKPYPVCRWAQPAIEAARHLREMQDPPLDHRRIERIDITTFHEGVRLAGHSPQTTEQAQYAIAYPTAVMLVKGRLGPDEIAPEALSHPEVVALSRRIHLEESSEFNDRFPAERWAQVSITLDSGTTIRSPATAAIGDPENPLSDEELDLKFRSLCQGRLPLEKATALRDTVRGLRSLEQSPADLMKLVRFPVNAPG